MSSSSNNTTVLWDGAAPGGPPLALDTAYTVLEAVVALAAVLGNGAVLCAFARERRLRRRTNYYIASLATADLLVGLLGVPCALLAAVGIPRQIDACLFTVSLLLVLCTASILSLVAVSFDRYWAILHPLAYSRHVRTRTALGIIAGCWILGTLIGFLPLFGWRAHVDDHFQCIFTKVMDYDYLVFLYFATIIFPALLLAAFYAHIYQVVIKQLRQMVTMNGQPTMLRVLGAAQKREVKAAQNLSVIVLFFVACWMPLYTLNCIQAFKPDLEPPKIALDICIVLTHLNSAGNPILYAYHLRDFRAALRSLLCGKKFLPSGTVHGGPPPPVLTRPSLCSQVAVGLQHSLSQRSLPAVCATPPLGTAPGPGPRGRMSTLREGSEDDGRVNSAYRREDLGSSFDEDDDVFEPEMVLHQRQQQGSSTSPRRALSEGGSPAAAGRHSQRRTLSLCDAKHGNGNCVREVVSAVT